MTHSIANYLIIILLYYTHALNGYVMLMHMTFGTPIRHSEQQLANVIYSIIYDVTKT